MTLPGANLSHSQPSEMWKNTPNDWSCDTVLAVWYYTHMRPTPLIRNWLQSAPFPWKTSCVQLKIHRVSVNFPETSVTLCLVQLHGPVVRRVISKTGFLLISATVLLRSLKLESPSVHTSVLLANCASGLVFGLQVVVSCGVRTAPGTLGSLSHLVSLGFTII